MKCLGLLNMETKFMDRKITGSLSYTLNNKIFNENISGKGHEIHYGITVNNKGLPLAYIDGKPEGSVNGNIYGTNIHGIFENRALLNHILHFDSGDYMEELVKNIDATSRLFTDNMDMELIDDLVL
jgi:Cobyric acid synthase